MTKYSPATMVVAEGLSMKIQDNSYHYHYRLNGKAYRKSTKTADKRKASKIALDAYNKTMYELENGILSETISFNSLLQKYLTFIKDETIYCFHEGTIKRHLKPFFSKFNDVSKIQLQHLDDYIAFRKSNIKNKANSSVSNSTLNKEAAVFNQIMRFAKKRKWVDEDLKIEHLKVEANPRPHFTPEQLKTLKKVATKRVLEFRNNSFKGQKKGLYQAKLWSRELILDLIDFIIDTGVRPCELSTIKWKDINLTESLIKLNNAGKVKSSRTFFIRTSKGVQALKRIKSRRLEYIKNSEGSFDENEYLQSLPNGIRVKCFKKGFRTLINFCDFQYGKDELRHVTYSLRHTYATYALQGIGGKRIPINILAAQMGTSIKMIEEHYGHDDTRDHIEFLVN